MSDYSELKRLAETCPTESVPHGCPAHKALIEYIAAANPAAVLALIDENQQLRTDRDYCKRVAEHNKEVGEQLKAENAGLKTGYEAYEQVVQGLKAENEALRLQVTSLAAECVRESDQVAQLETDCDEAQAVIARMALEMDKSVQDSARLDWLDTKFTNIVEGQCYHDPHGELVGHQWSVGGPHSEVRDAIDAAMSKGEQP